MRCRRAERKRSRSGSPEASKSMVVRAAQASASVARSPPIQRLSGPLHSVGACGYAAAGWSRSKWRFQVSCSTLLESLPSRLLDSASDPYRKGSYAPYARAYPNSHAAASIKAKPALLHRKHRTGTACMRYPFPPK